MYALCAHRKHTRDRVCQFSAGVNHLFERLIPNVLDQIGSSSSAKSRSSLVLSLSMVFADTRDIRGSRNVPREKMKERK